MILVAPAPAIRASQPPPVGNDTVTSTAFLVLLRDFTSERDAVLFRPDTTPETYQALVSGWAGRLALETLSLDELSQAARAGLLDFSPAREQAAAQVDALAPATTPLRPEEGARAAALRLRLLGCVTLGGSPPRETQERLLTTFLDHPGLPALMQTGGQVDVLDALCHLGRVSVMRAHRDKIAATVGLLDAQTPGAQEMAADLSRIAALLTLAAPSASSGAEYRASLERLLAFGRAAVGAAGAGGEVDTASRARRERVRQQVGWLESLLNGQRSDEEIQSRDEETKRTLLRASSVPTWFWGLLRVAYAEDDPLALRFEIARPPSRQAVFEPAAGSRVEQTTLAFRQAVVSPQPEASARAFGEAEIRDPFLRLSADEFGLDPVSKRLVTRNFTLDMHPYIVRARRIALDRDAVGEVEDLRLIAYLGGTTLVSVSTPHITRDEQGQTRIKDARVSAFGTRLLTLRSLAFRSSNPSEKTAEEPAPSAASQGPKGQSPSSTWARLPTIGTFEGGLSVGYSNAVKFGGRWSVPFRYTANAAAPESADISVNYNLRAVTNSVDHFLDEVKFEQEFWESSYFNVRPTDQVKENEILFTKKLLVGVYAQKNQFRTDPDGNLHAASVPLSARIEGGGGLGRAVGFRGQVAWERIDDPASGTEQRWLLLGSVGPPSARLARGIDGFVRADGGAKLGSDDYGWYRGLAGLTALLLPELRLSSAYYNSVEDGTAQFDFDRVPADHGYSVRADTTLGSFRLALMNQYSTRLNRWTRWQAVVGLGVGVLEPYASFDQRFSSISFGLTVRMDTFTDRYLNRRYLGGNASSPAVVPARSGGN